MTPEVAARLKVHDDTALIEPTVGRRQLAAAADMPAALELRDLDTRHGPISVEGRASASLKGREAMRRWLLGISDITAAAAAQILILSFFAQHNVLPATLVGVALVLFLFKLGDLYDRDDLRLVRSTLDELPLLAQLTGLFALSTAVLQEEIALTGSLAADQIAALWLGSLCAIVIGRVIARAVAGRLSPTERCLVIGDGERVDRIRDKLASSRSRAAVVASLPLAGEVVDDRDWTTMPAEIRRIVGELNVDRIIIAPSTTDGSGVVQLIRIAKAVGVRVSVSPRLFEVVGSAVEFDHVDGMTMLGVRRFGLSRSSRLLKRMFDVAITSLGILLVSPFIAAISLAIRLDSHGPIFFRQIRVGRDGRHFSIFKFRSMVVDADARKDDLRALNEAGQGLFKISEDPRITRVGRFLRNTSLDELPQLLNVLRGEMSLVGPRPLVVDEDAQVVGLDRSRLYLTPGMTGPWQIMGSRVPMQEMIGIDYLYVANWSLWADLKILLRTVRHILRRGNV